MSGSSIYLVEAIHNALEAIYEFESSEEASVEAEELAEYIQKNYAIIISPLRRKSYQ